MQPSITGGITVKKIYGLSPIKKLESIYKSTILILKYTFFTKSFFRYIRYMYVSTKETFEHRYTFHLRILKNCFCLLSHISDIGILKFNVCLTTTSKCKLII